MNAQVLIEEFQQRGKSTAKRVCSSHGSTEDALEAAKALVESGLLELWRRGMSAQALVNQWLVSGEDVVVQPETGSLQFSATDYAKARANDLAVRGML